METFLNLKRKRLLGGSEALLERDELAPRIGFGMSDLSNDTGRRCLENEFIYRSKGFVLAVIRGKIFLSKQSESFVLFHCDRVDMAGSGVDCRSCWLTRISSPDRLRWNIWVDESPYSFIVDGTFDVGYPALPVLRLVKNNPVFVVTAARHRE